MSLIDEIRKMPRDLPLNHAIMHVERITVDDLVLLADVAEKAKAIFDGGTRGDQKVQEYQALYRALEECEKR